MAFQDTNGYSDEGDKDGDGKEGRDWRLPFLFYADDLVLCGESEEELRAMMGLFGEVCRRCLKVNTSKSKVMLLNGQKGLECEVHVDGLRLEHVSEFKYLGVKWLNQIQMGQSVIGRWQVPSGP